MATADPDDLELDLPQCSNSRGAIDEATTGFRGGSTATNRPSWWDGSWPEPVVAGGSGKSFGWRRSAPDAVQAQELTGARITTSAELAQADSERLVHVPGSLYHGRVVH